eukprot:4345985-Amphidinium_carterae.1
MPKRECLNDGRDRGCVASGLTSKLKNDFPTSTLAVSAAALSNVGMAQTLAVSAATLSKFALAQSSSSRHKSVRFKISCWTSARVMSLESMTHSSLCCITRLMKGQ